MSFLRRQTAINRPRRFCWVRLGTCVLPGWDTCWHHWHRGLCCSQRSEPAPTGGRGEPQRRPRGGSSDQASSWQLTSTLLETRKIIYIVYYTPSFIAVILHSLCLFFSVFNMRLAAQRAAKCRCGNTITIKRPCVLRSAAAVASGWLSSKSQRFPHKHAKTCDGCDQVHLRQNSASSNKVPH